MPHDRYDVYAAGNALVDIQAQVDPEFLQRHALAKGVMTLVEPGRQRELLSHLDPSALHTSAGGSACNTVVGLAGFGGRGYYAGKIGQDAYGRFFQEELSGLGIRSDLAPSASPTGTCLVLITPDADRTMLTCLSASVELSAADVRPELIAQSLYVYVEGYLWDTAGPRAACLRAISEAHRAGVKVAFSFSDPFCVSRAQADFERLAREEVDLIFCNRDEACMITGETDGANAGRRIASWGPDVYVTLGAAGACFASKDRCVSIAAFPAVAKDTNGAGDLFAGGALFGLCRGYSPEDAGRLGSYAASQVVQQVGARLPADVLSRALRVLEEQAR